MEAQTYKDAHVVRGYKYAADASPSTQMLFACYMIVYDLCICELCCCACLCATLRLLQGVGRPDEVLACVEAGVDLFESFFPFQVTERGCALCFSFDISPDPERAGSAPPAGGVNRYG